MTLDELHKRVTAEILRLEALPPGSPDAEDLSREICLLEREIARLTEPGEARGVAARIGAVISALEGADPLGAVRLSTEYLAESIPSRARVELEQLLAEAKSALEHATSDPIVHPIRFELKAA